MSNLTRPSFGTLPLWKSPEEQKLTSLLLDLPETKTVRFQIENTVHYPPDTASAPEAMWYTFAEYDQLKYNAAKHAGVKITRHGSKEAGLNYRYCLEGNFDDNQNVGEASCANTGKVYNGNEYNDLTVLKSREEICKRGLGYHFSITRKKHRTAIRSNVLSVQKKLLRYSSAQSGRKLQRDLKAAAEKNLEKKNKKSQLVLALVSTKYSRSSREEARWRGKVDYWVAYPERHVASDMPPPPDARKSDVMGSSSKRRSGDKATPRDDKGFDDAADEVRGADDCHG